ncbi:Uncharacterised protein [Mycobacterium tuberculosis]|nr:Uncharacterised protein [Mycobacterium tuberculosis]
MYKKLIFLFTASHHFFNKFNEMYHFLLNLLVWYISIQNSSEHLK